MLNLLQIILEKCSKNYVDNYSSERIFGADILSIYNEKSIGSKGSS